MDRLIRVRVDLSKRVYHCTRMCFARSLHAPEIGLRASARLLNCPDATDDTIGIYANF